MEDGSRVACFWTSCCVLDWLLSASPLLARNKPLSGRLLPCPVGAPGRMHVPGSTALDVVARVLFIDGLFVMVRMRICRWIGSAADIHWKRSVGQRSHCRKCIGPHRRGFGIGRYLDIELSTTESHFEMRDSRGRGGRGRGRSRSRNRARVQLPREDSLRLDEGGKEEVAPRMPADSWDTANSATRIMRKERSDTTL